MLRHIVTTLIVFATLATGGCGSSPKLVTTAKPTRSQIELCRLRLYLGRQTDILPDGFQRYMSNEETIWFKFQTKVATLPTLLDSKRLQGAQFETVTKFQDRYEMPTYSDTAEFTPAWWDPQEQILFGGRLNTPGTEVLSIGVSNADGRERPGERAIVYILLKKV